MSKFGKVLLLICLVDLAMTLLLITSGIAGEANPLLSYYFMNWGATGLVVSKMWLVLIPLFVLEAGQRTCPYAKARIVYYYKIAIGSYVILFASGNLI